MKIDIKYSKKADSVYLHFSDEKVAYSKRLDAERSVDYSHEGEIRGIRFLTASSGLKTDDLPYRTAIDRALYDKGIAGIMHKPGAPQDASAQKKARIKNVMLAVAAGLFFISMIVADVLLARNMFILSRNMFILNVFVLTSLLGLLASVIGLFFTLLPTVVGILFIFAWVILATGLAGRYQ